MEGLVAKYNVTKLSDGSVVDRCFVLCPLTDYAARQALYTYAMTTDNQQLSDELLAWLTRMPELPEEKEPEPYSGHVKPGDLVYVNTIDENRKPCKRPAIVTFFDDNDHSINARDINGEMHYDIPFDSFTKHEGGEEVAPTESQ